MAEKSKRKRIYFLDELRGFAILCMIVHHAFLDVGDVLDLLGDIKFLMRFAPFNRCFGLYLLLFREYAQDFREIR